MKEYHITPIPKPRMTQRDKWAKRPCVQKYWAFKEECREKGVRVPDSSYVCFMFAMPKSWSNQKRQEMYCKPHTGKPDIDNLIKALLDALYDDDSHIHEIHAKKLWGHANCFLVGKIK